MVDLPWVGAFAAAWALGSEAAEAGTAERPTEPMAATNAMAAKEPRAPDAAKRHPEGRRREVICRSSLTNRAHLLTVMRASCSVSDL